MPILFFILWLLLAGEVTLHVCLWGVVASALLSCFCHQVLGYRLSPRRGTLGKGLSFLKYLGHLVVYGVGGVVLPFVAIKLLDMALVAVGV